MARRVAPRRTADAPAEGSPRPRTSLSRVGPLVITPFRAVIGVAFLGSAAYIAVAILFVRDTTQIPMLSSGFAVLGLACAAVALGGAISMWRAASGGRSGAALALAVLGGGFGMAAIGCFTLAALLALVWKA